MWNQPTLKQLNKLPKLREQDNSHTANTIIHMHLFLGENDWFISEFDGDDTFFGFAILNGDDEMAEWGYISFKELIDLKIQNWCEVDRDIHWKPKAVCEIDKIVNAGGSW